jgi:dTDP-glucose 4,6-dehydratase
MRRVVVTGGAGFLGSHLVDALLAAGEEVVAFDDLSTGRMRNLAHLDGHERFTFVKTDVVEGIPIDGAVDAVLHFASPASPPQYLARPFETLDVGSAGTRNALDLAHDNAARFLFASTSEIYGEPLEHPQAESYNGNVSPTGVRAVYDEAKRFGEALTAAYRRELGVDAGIVRIFNTYGPRLEPADGRVVSNFCVQALQGKPITVYGDGSQTRSYCYVDDEVRGILALLDSGVCDPVNIGSPDEFTVAELAKLVVEVSGSSSEIVHMGLPEDDPTRRRPDITRARDLLGWQPLIELAEGLSRSLAWYREELALERSDG